MLRKLCLLLGFFFVISMSAQAQGIADKIQLFGGYSYMHFGGPPSGSLNGWEIAGQYKFTDWLGGVADFDGHYGSPSGPSNSTHTYLFGPEVSYPARISPFAHVLIGGAHSTIGGVSDTSFATAIGFGIDNRINDLISWRMIQGDYLITHVFGTTQNNARLSTGIVFHF
jgi:hypothetical protein